MHDIVLVHLTTKLGCHVYYFMMGSVSVTFAEGPV